MALQSQTVLRYPLTIDDCPECDDPEFTKYPPPVDDHTEIHMDVECQCGWKYSKPVSGPEYGPRIQLTIKK